MTDPLGLISSAGGAGPVGGPTPGASKSDAAGGANFKDLLMKNIEQVNALQTDAERAIEDLAAGRRDDLAGVMIAKQKADIAFETLLQVRNKLMDAYDEFRQMRV